MRKAGIVLGAVVLVLAASVGGAAAAGLVTVSGPSPYASCSNANQPGTVYLNAEVEPQVAVNPATVGTGHVNVVGTWQQDRWSNGGAHGLVAGFSSDGGKTWGETSLPFSACAPNAIADPFTGSGYNRASDPWVSIGPDGTAYAAGLLATNSTDGGINDTGVATVTSTDGGRTWSNPNLERADQGTSPIFEATHFFNDKESITADPVHAGTAYVVWDRLQAPSHSPDAALKAHAFRGPTWFSKTTDGGKTWSTARPIFDPGQNSQTIGNIVVVDPRTGKLYDFFDQFSTTGSPKFTPRGDSVSFITSTDGGVTWSKASVVSDEQTVLDVDPNTGAALRTEETLPSVAVDPVTGELYVVWEDARFTGGAVNQAVISTSTDGGATWSVPAPVSTPSGTPAFTPTVAVNANGSVAVTYYDLRNLPSGDTSTLPTDVWLKTSPRGGGAFGPDTHVAGSFNMLVAPSAGGFFVGDYEGLGVIGSSFLPFFVQTNCTDNSCTGNRTDVYAGSF
jgi:BNR/Asp-box repeat protein